jgi:hypothetical protein
MKGNIGGGGGGGGIEMRAREMPPHHAACRRCAPPESRRRRARLIRLYLRRRVLLVVCNGKLVRSTSTAADPVRVPAPVHTAALRGCAYCTGYVGLGTGYHHYYWKIYHWPLC